MTLRNRYLPFKFQDGSAGKDQKQPRSMRKYLSDNVNFGKPVIPGMAPFRPQGGGEHDPDPDQELRDLPTRPSPSGSPSPSAPGAPAPGDFPATPSLPSGVPPGGAPPAAAPSVPV